MYCNGECTIEETFMQIIGIRFRLFCCDHDRLLFFSGFHCRLPYDEIGLLLFDMTKCVGRDRVVCMA